MGPCLLAGTAAIVAALATATATPVPEHHPVLVNIPHGHQPRAATSPVFLPIRKAPRAAHRKRSLDDRAELINWNRDRLYDIDVDIGTPPQTFSLAIDTGSPDLWVMGNACNTTTCTGQPLFDPAASSTWRDNHTGVVLAFGSGVATGTWGTDRVSFDTVSQEHQDLVVINSTAVHLLNDYKTQGLLGLSWPLGNHPKPAWQNILEATDFETRAFSIYLERDLRPRGNTSGGYSSGPGGQFVMGGYNRALFSGELNWLPKVEMQRPYWTVQLDALAVNGQNISRAAGNNAIVDTGTSLSYGSIAQVRDFYEQIPGTTNSTYGNNFWAYEFPCDALANTTVVWTFGGVEYEVYPGDLVAYRSDDGKNCTGSLQGGFILGMIATSNVDWILGADFLKNVYTSYRLDPPAVGMARLVDAANHRDPALLGGSDEPGVSSAVSSAVSSTVSSAASSVASVAVSSASSSAASSAAATIPACPTAAERSPATERAASPTPEADRGDSNGQ